MEKMFCGCENLQELKFSDLFQLSNTINSIRMFDETALQKKSSSDDRIIELCGGKINDSYKISQK